MIPATQAALARKNRELYDDTFGRVWRAAIFDGLHGGHEFINLGGAPLLGRIARRVALRPGMRVLELCSGPGAVAAYFAQRYDCRVTGIDLNLRQVAHARAMRRSLPAATRARLTFVRGDACTWHSDVRFDAVVSVDAFMLLADAAAALRVAREALAPGGRLAIATLAAGPRIGLEFRRFASEMDGMVNLRTAAACVRLGRDAGFASIRATDMTRAAVRASVRMLECLYDIDASDDWTHVSQVYLDALSTARLRYLLISARS